MITRSSSLTERLAKRRENLPSMNSHHLRTLISNTYAQKRGSPDTTQLGLRGEQIIATMMTTIAMPTPMSTTSTLTVVLDQEIIRVIVAHRDTRIMITAAESPPDATIVALTMTGTVMKKKNLTTRDSNWMQLKETSLVIIHKSVRTRLTTNQRLTNITQKCSHGTVPIDHTPLISKKIYDIMFPPAIVPLRDLSIMTMAKPTSITSRNKTKSTFLTCRIVRNMSHRRGLDPKKMSGTVITERLRFIQDVTARGKRISTIAPNATMSTPLIVIIIKSRLAIRKEKSLSMTTLRDNTRGLIGVVGTYLRMTGVIVRDSCAMLKKKIENIAARETLQQHVISIVEPIRKTTRTNSTENRSLENLHKLGLHVTQDVDLVLSPHPMSNERKRQVRSTSLLPLHTLQLLRHLLSSL